jgi:hypothetical protein
MRYIKKPNHEKKLIKQVAILVIVSVVEIDVIVIVIKVQELGIIVHYNQRT